jgi:hypothetical protein
MSRDMKAEELDAIEKKYGFKPTRLRTCLDAWRSMSTRTTAQVDDAAAGRCGVLEDAQRRLQRGHHDLGPAGLDRWNGPASPSACTAATRRRVPTATSRITRSRRATTRTRSRNNPARLRSCRA